MADFIDESRTMPPVYTLKPNLTLNSDMTLSPTPANIEAMGANYFDKTPKQAGQGFGHHRNSDYVNYYGASAISYAVQADTAYANPSTASSRE